MTHHGPRDQDRQRSRLESLNKLIAEDRAKPPKGPQFGLTEGLVAMLPIGATCGLLRLLAEGDPLQFSAGFLFSALVCGLAMLATMAKRPDKPELGEFYGWEIVAMAVVVTAGLILIPRP